MGTVINIIQSCPEKLKLMMPVSWYETHYKLSSISGYYPWLWPIPSLSSVEMHSTKFQCCFMNVTKSRKTQPLLYSILCHFESFSSLVQNVLDGIPTLSSLAVRCHSNEPLSFLLCNTLYRNLVISKRQDQYIPFSEIFYYSHLLPELRISVFCLVVTFSNALQLL